METITEIDECDDGFLVKTTEQIITLHMNTDVSCCENPGYFWTNDDPKAFVGAAIAGVHIVDECLIKEKAPNIYEGGVMFVNIETDRGTLQFTAYNHHNGYYGHTATVKCSQLNHSECL
jgi:hypothetical protein